MVRRKNSPLYDSFLLCRNSIRKDLSHIAHKRRNVRFKGLRRVHTPPQPLTAHTAAHRVKQGAFRVGGAITTLGPFRTVRNLCARSGQKSILCHLCMDRGNVGEKQRAFGTAMRSCASLFRGVAAPLGCVIPLLFLSQHRWVSRFWSAASLAYRKLSACSLVGTK